MKLSDVKQQIDAYFDTVNPHEIVARFELLGYEFEDLPIGYNIVTSNSNKSSNTSDEFTTFSFPTQSSKLDSNNRGQIVG